MDDYWSAIIAALSVLSGVALTHHFAQRQWRNQQQWAVREKHYMELLRQLTRARLSLETQSEYFEQPWSPADDVRADPRFVQLRKDAREAFATVEELAGPARVFLSPQAILALEDLVRSHWSVSMDAMHLGEYVAEALALVKKADLEVLAAANAHLNE